MATDLKRTLPGYTARAGRFELLELPPRRYLAVDGEGDPNEADRLADVTAALYPVAYALKFASKAQGRDYVVPPLEGLWWADDTDSFTTRRDKSAWHWTLLLLVPDWLTDDDIDHAQQRVLSRPRASKDATGIDVRVLDEGLCVQTLHIGPFDDEGPTIAALHASMEQTHVLRGRHHEIYLSDVRRTAPERRRTILRQPVSPNP